MNIWIDHQIESLEAVSISPLAHALHYGTGVFEGIRAYATPFGPAIFRLEEHLERLQRGADTLGMAVGLAALRRGALEVLAQSGLKEAYLRPLAFFETGALGLDLDTLKVRQLVAALPWNNHLKGNNVRLHVSSLRRNPSEALPPLKLCGNYVNSVLAKREASLAGFDEALFLDGEGHVVECTGENVFLVSQGRITAALHKDALPGITRDTIIQLSGAVSRPVHVQELLEADEVFVTGTSAEITPVGALDSRQWDTGPVTLELQALYQEVVHGKSPAWQHWLTPLPTTP